MSKSPKRFSLATIITANISMNGMTKQTAGNILKFDVEGCVTNGARYARGGGLSVVTA
jgi:hypothetical protein